MAKKAQLMGEVRISQFNQVFYDVLKPTFRYHSRTYLIDTNVVLFIKLYSGLFNKARISIISKSTVGIDIWYCFEYMNKSICWISWSI